MMFFSAAAVRKALDKYGAIPHLKFPSLYDLRLKVSIDHSIYHLQEPLYCVIGTEEYSDGEKIFTYVDPCNEAVQKEMETVFTDYLKKVKAYLPSHYLREVEQTPESFPVEASVIIPVRNRKETIAEAVESAFSQETNFPFICMRTIYTAAAAPCRRWLTSFVRATMPCSSALTPSWIRGWRRFRRALSTTVDGPMRMATTMHCASTVWGHRGLSTPA